jgi:hypothetical protein
MAAVDYDEQESAALIAREPTDSYDKRAVALKMQDQYETLKDSAFAALREGAGQAYVEQILEPNNKNLAMSLQPLAAGSEGQLRSAQQLITAENAAKSSNSPWTTLMSAIVAAFNINYFMGTPAAAKIMQEIGIPSFADSQIVLMRNPETVTEEQKEAQPALAAPSYVYKTLISNDVPIPEGSVYDQWVNSILPVQLTDWFRRLFAARCLFNSSLNIMLEPPPQSKMLRITTENVVGCMETLLNNTNNVVARCLQSAESVAVPGKHLPRQLVNVLKEARNSAILDTASLYTVNNTMVVNIRQLTLVRIEQTYVEVTNVNINRNMPPEQVEWQNQAAAQLAALKSQSDALAQQQVVVQQQAAAAENSSMQAIQQLKDAVPFNIYQRSTTIAKMLTFPRTLLLTIESAIGTFRELTSMRAGLTTPDTEQSLFQSMTQTMRKVTDDLEEINQVVFDHVHGIAEHMYGGAPESDETRALSARYDEFIKLRPMLLAPGEFMDYCDKSVVFVQTGCDLLIDMNPSVQQIKQTSEAFDFKSLQLQKRVRGLIGEKAEFTQAAINNQYHQNLTIADGTRVIEDVKGQLNKMREDLNAADVAIQTMKQAQQSGADINNNVMASVNALREEMKNNTIRLSNEVAGLSGMASTIAQQVSELTKLKKMLEDHITLTDERFKTAEKTLNMEVSGLKAAMLEQTTKFQSDIERLTQANNNLAMLVTQGTPGGDRPPIPTDTLAELVQRAEKNISKNLEEKMEKNFDAISKELAQLRADMAKIGEIERRQTQHEAKLEEFRQELSKHYSKEDVNRLVGTQRDEILKTIEEADVRRAHALTERLRGYVPVEQFAALREDANGLLRSNGILQGEMQKIWGEIGAIRNTVETIQTKLRERVVGAFEQPVPQPEVRRIVREEGLKQLVMNIL